MEKTTLILTYNKVDGFEEGSHGNGRVVILKLDPQKFDGKNSEGDAFGLYFRTFNLLGREIDKAYIYLGRYDSLQDKAIKMFQAMYRVASSHIKDSSRIFMVGCKCNENLKRRFAEHSGMQFLKSNCGGEETLSKIVREILAELPQEPVAKKESLTLHLDFYNEQPSKEAGFFTSSSFVEFASIGDTIFAGCGDGAVFVKKNRCWTKSSLLMKQGVNLIVPDGDSVLIGDGSCCSGQTWRLDLDGHAEQIFPVAGQDDRDGNIRCNVYGFARIKDKLLTGGGGCAGTHIYELNKDGRWQYLSNDPGKYVTCMFTTTDGKAYIIMNDTTYQYDGEIFTNLGRINGHSHAIREFGGEIFIGSTDSGNCYPTNFSTGYVYKIIDGQLRKVWSGTGGIRGFFEHKESFYAWGHNHAKSWKTIVLKLTGGSWEKLLEVPETLYFFSHGDTIYAGGKKDSHGAIYTAEL